MTQTIQLEIAAPLAEIILDQPQRRNALSLDVFLHDGDRTFAPPVHFPLLLPPLFLASADFVRAALATDPVEAARLMDSFSEPVEVVTLLTVSFQSVRAALANPVKSLRSE